MTRLRNTIRNAAYYAIKPMLPRSARMAARRWAARRKRRHVADEWPIYPGSARQPNGWAGWPGGREFAIVLTHDVEGPSGLENVIALAELEIRFGVRSCFNFVPEGSYRVPSGLRSWLVERGFEVGVHDLHHDGWLYSSRQGFIKRARRINTVLSDWGACGFRSAFMLNRLDWLHDLEICYDASTFDTDPFEPQPEGQHTIFPFPVIDGDRRYIELPTTLPQDSTLFLLLGETGIDVWKNKLRWIAQRGGMALLNVHPDYMLFGGSAPQALTYPARHYENLLEFIHTAPFRDHWMALPRDVANCVAGDLPNKFPPQAQPLHGGKISAVHLNHIP